jgi:hypothetical protein
MGGIIPPGTAALWLGNDTFSDAAAGFSVFAMDLGGNLLIEVQNTAMTGVAFDGTNLWFSSPVSADPSVADLTKRNTDGTLVPGATFSPQAFSPSTEDLTFDTKRQLLWRIDNDPATLVQIDPATGAVVQSFALSAAGLDPDLKGGYGIAYDNVKDVLYVSFGRLDGDPFPNHFMEGVVKTADPATGAITGELFRTDAVASGETTFATGGLAYQPGTGTLTGEGTLWVGDLLYVRHMSLTGEVIARVRSPHPSRFVDGLEFVSGSC